MISTDKKALIAIAVVFTLLIVGGQLLIYVVKPYNYSVEIKCEGELLTYEIKASTPTPYDVVIVDNPLDNTNLYLYKDSNYGTFNINKKTADQNLNELSDEMRIRGFSPAYKNADELISICNDSSKAKETGIVFFYGAFPVTIYNGNENSPVLKFLKNGGHIYWANGKIGQYYSYSDGRLVDIMEDPGVVFFNQNDCINIHTSKLDKDSKNRDIGLSLNIFSWKSENGLKSDLPHSVSIGYDDKNGYGSVVVAKYYGGNGSICVFGSHSSYDGRNGQKNFAQTICSCVSYKSNLISHSAGTCKNMTGTIDLSKHSGNISVYIYLGNTFVTAACYHHHIR